MIKLIVNDIKKVVLCPSREVVYEEDEDGVWACRDCGLLWVLSNCGKPSEHRMHFCPQCGGKIVEEKGWGEEE